VVVAGGAGVAGECVVHALLRRGARVVVPSRTESRLTELMARVDPAHRERLHLVVGDVGTEPGVEAVRDAVVREHGAPRAVVASLGAWWEGEQLVDVSTETWNRVLHDNLTAHFLVARTFLPVLDQEAAPVYVTLAGIAADHPEPFASPISITGAAQRMLLRTLAVGDIGARVRLHEVAIMTPVVTARWDGPDPAPEWLPGEVAGDYVADVVAPDFTGELLLEIPDGGAAGT
jgi:NAD(P)-dependent dehydrogenase (short-subunit alcohol dehydrogenase family)